MTVIFVVFQVLDGISAAVAARINPGFLDQGAIGGIMSVDPGWALIFKGLGIVFVVSAITIVGVKRPRLASGLWALGIVAGAVGLISNLAVLEA